MDLWKPGHDDEVNEEDGGGEEGEDADCQDGPVLEENIITLFGEEVPAFWFLGKYRQLWIRSPCSGRWRCQSAPA